VEVGQGEERESIFLLNMVGVDRVIDEINSGRIKIEIDNVIMDASPPAEPLSDVFKYYEENIGMLTPLISDELRLAVGEYPAEWIIDAIRRAVLNNKRNWRYVSRILENWQVEGKSDGAYRQDNTKEDPTKYVRGKYQKFVQH
jgi:DnaD/phage-associated family protein